MSRHRCNTALSLLFASLALGCAKQNTRVELASDDNQGSGPLRATTEADRGERPDIERTQLSASVVGLGDMLDAGGRVLATWVPTEPGAPPIDLRAWLELAVVQTGFSPTWLAKVDLDGLHTFEVGIPREDQVGVTEGDLRLAVSVASSDPHSLLDGLPAEPPVQPAGDGLWQLRSDDAPLWLRPRAEVLEAATSLELLDALTGVRAAARPSPDAPRLRVSASNLGQDVADFRPMLTAWGVDQARHQEVLETLEFEVFADFGSDRDLVLGTAMVGSFGDVTRGGPALREPSALAELLPAGALVTLVQSWSQTPSVEDPAQVMAALDLPEIEERSIVDVLDRWQTLALSMRPEVVAATYVDGKGRATLVFLAELEDEAAARIVLDELLAGLASGSARISHQKAALRIGKRTGDVLSIAIEGEVGHLPWLFGTGTPTLEVGSFIDADKLVIAMGPGQRDFVKRLAPRLRGSSDGGLEAGGGLATARALTDGCQTCIAIDPSAVLAGMLAILANDPDGDRAFRALIATAQKRLAKLGLSGQLGAGARFDPSRWAVVASAPKRLLFLDAGAAKQLRETAGEIAKAHASLGIDPKQLCQHVFDLIARELPDGAPHSAEELATQMAKCERDLNKERAQKGEAEFRREFDCVMAAWNFEALTSCSAPRDGGGEQN